MTLPGSAYDIVERYPALSPGEAKFAAWLQDKLPYLADLWDWENSIMDFELVDRYLSTASHGQAIMCRFAVGVWRWTNDRDFDLFEAAQTLDDENMAIISEWAQSPWFVG